MRAAREDLPEPEGPASSTTRVGIDWEFTEHECEALTRAGDPPVPVLVSSITPQLLYAPR
ncbi:hypothetical protein GCM10010433_12090 [Streptomyces pulveraceus]